MSWWNNWYVSFLSWRVRHIKERNFIIILSLLVGIVTGLAGVFLKNSVHLTHQFFTERLQKIGRASGRERVCLYV